MKVGSAAECIGDEVLFVELSDDAGLLSGKACEAYAKECYELVDATVQGRHVVFAYEFSGYRVDADFELSADGSTLSGAYASTKCGCEVPVTLHRVPES